MKQKRILLIAIIGFIVIGTIFLFNNGKEQSDFTLKDTSEKEMNETTDKDDVAKKESKQNTQTKNENPNNMDRLEIDKEDEKTGDEIDEIPEINYEEPLDLYDYNSDFDEEHVAEAIRKMYDVFFLLSNQSSAPDLEQKWKEVTTDELFRKLSSEEKELFNFMGYKEFELVPVESSEYNGIVIGLFVATSENAGLFEFDYKVENNTVLLDDYEPLWSTD